MQFQLIKITLLLNSTRVPSSIISMSCLESTKRTMYESYGIFLTLSFSQVHAFFNQIKIHFYKIMLAIHPLRFLASSEKHKVFKFMRVLEFSKCFPFACCMRLQYIRISLLQNSACISFSEIFSVILKIRNKQLV